MEELLKQLAEQTEMIQHYDNVVLICITAAFCIAMYCLLTRAE